MSARTRSIGTRRAGHTRRRSSAPALGYASVGGSADLDGPEIAAQRDGIEAACARLGLELVSLVTDREPNGDTARPGLSAALERLEAGEASCLIVSDLERLSRRVGELAAVVDRMERRKVRLIALDVGLDTATPSGRLALEPGEPPADEAAVAPAAEAPLEPVAVEAQPVEPADAAVVEPAVGSADAETVEPAGAAVVEPAIGSADAATVEPDGAAAAEPAEAAVFEPAVEAPVEAPAVDPAVAAPVAPEVETPVVAPVVPEVETPPEREAEPEPATARAGEPRDGAPRAARELVLALGYASVTAEGNAARDLDEQKLVIEREAERLGFRLVEVVREREPKTGRALDRAGLSYLIGRVAAGDASCVVVSGLDRLSRSVAELGTIVQWFERSRVRLVAADIELDTASPGGHTTALALASVAKWEHERVSERTRSGLAAARAKRRAAAGPDLVQVRERIARMRADGMTLQAIADVLNAEGVPTQRGGAEWRPSSVQTAAGYKRRTRAKQVEDLPTVGKPPRTPDSGVSPDPRDPPAA